MGNGAKRGAASLRLRSFVSKEEPGKRGAATGRAGGSGTGASRGRPRSVPRLLPPIPPPAGEQPGQSAGTGETQVAFLGGNQCVPGASRPFQPHQSTQPFLQLLVLLPSVSWHGIPMAF